MTSVVLDSNIYDEVVATLGMTDDLTRLAAAGQLQILTTHVQQDELAGIADPVKRQAVLRIPRQLVPTAGAISGVSRIGQARVGDGSADGLDVAGVQKGNPKYSEDALIAVTAAREGCILVTNDEKLARKVRARAATTEVWDFPMFAAHVAQLKSRLP